MASKHLQAPTCSSSPRQRQTHTCPSTHPLSAHTGYNICLFQSTSAHRLLSFLLSLPAGNRCSHEAFLVLMVRLAEELGGTHREGSWGRCQITSLLCPSLNAAINRPGDAGFTARKDRGTLTQTAWIWNNWLTVPWHAEDHGLSESLTFQGEILPDVHLPPSHPVLC